MCADYNRKGALDILAGLKDSNEIIRIKELVMQGDFSGAEAFISDLFSKSKSMFADKNISGIDIKKGIEKYGGDEEIYLNILRSYVASTNSMLDIIENVDEETLNDYTIKVHGIKGTSRDMFAEKVGEAAAGLEKAAKAGDFDYIYQYNPKFIKSARKLISGLEALIAEIDADNPKLKKEKPDGELLSKLLEASNAYDMNGADEIMAELRKYEYENDSDNELINWLGEKYDMTKFGEMAEKLSSILEK